MLSTSRGFTEEEDQYFADAARKAYVSFITKAAASRNMTVDAMNEVRANMTVCTLSLPEVLVIADFIFL